MLAASVVASVLVMGSLAWGRRQRKWRKGDCLYLSTLPLMSMSHAELHSQTARERLDQLESLLGHIHGDECENPADIPTEQLFATVQENEMVRRLTSLIMQLLFASETVHCRGDEELRFHPLIQKLVKLWPRLLSNVPKKIRPPSTMPREAKIGQSRNGSSNTMPTKIALIVPAYKEEGSRLLGRLTEAYNRATRPGETIASVIIVDAGGNADLQQAVKKLKEQCPIWYQNDIIHLDLYDGGGGRGPCLNYGARAAAATEQNFGTCDIPAKIFSFLHSDTLLPQGWDESITNTFETDDRVTLTAFSFGVDAPAGKFFRRPLGISWIEWGVNLRCHWKRLPYGDQCLSIRRNLFEYIGGFPDECMMEDYALVSLLGQRTKSLGSSERIEILPESVQCSARRWEQFGVIYVTLVNSWIIRLYNRSGKAPDDLFRIYYGIEPPQRQDVLSTWERNLATILSKSR